MNEGAGEIANDQAPWRRVWLPIMAWAVLLSIVMMAFSGLIENRYLRHNAFFFDPVAYLNEYRALAEAVEKEGRWQVAGDELREGVMPGWTLPLVLVAPNFLEFQTGHLLALLPMMMVGLFALGIWTYARWRSRGFALAVMLLLATTPGYAHPVYGLGAFWLDHAAGFPAVAAIVALLFWMERGGWRWLLLFGMLTLWTVSVRYVAAGYLLVIGGPLVVVGLVRAWRRGSWRRCLGEGAVLAGLMLVLPMPFLLSRLEGRMAHYDLNSFGYQGVWDSLVYAYACFVEYVHPVYLIVVAVAALGLAAGGGQPRDGWRSWWLPFWLANGVLLFLGLSTQIGVAGQSTFFQVPFLVLALVSVPCAQPREAVQRVWRLQRGGLRITATVAGFLMIASLLSGGINARNAWHATATTDLAQLDRTRLYRQFLAQLRELPESTTVALLFENTELEGPRLQAETAHRLDRKLHLPPSLYLYHLETLWQAHYPEETPEQVADHFIEQLDRAADLAIAYAEPDRALAEAPNDFSAFRNPYSDAVAVAAARHLKNSPDWEPIFQIRTEAYGLLTGYGNRSREKAGSHLH